jgi:hypothetical protein
VSWCNAACGIKFQQRPFAGTVLPSIVDGRALSRPKLKASGTFFHPDNAGFHLTSGRYDKFGIKTVSSFRQSGSGSL